MNKRTRYFSVLERFGDDIACMMFVPSQCLYSGIPLTSRDLSADFLENKEGRKSPEIRVAKVIIG